MQIGIVLSKLDYRVVGLCLCTYHVNITAVYVLLSCSGVLKRFPFGNVVESNDHQIFGKLNKNIFI